MAAPDDVAVGVGDGDGEAAGQATRRTWTVTVEPTGACVEAFGFCE